MEENIFTLKHSWPGHILGEHWRQRRHRRRTRRRLPWCRRLEGGFAVWSPWWWTWPAGWSPQGPPLLALPCSPARTRTRRRGQSWSKGCRWSGCRKKALWQRPGPLWDSCTPLVRCIGRSKRWMEKKFDDQFIFKVTCCCCYIAVLVAAVGHFETTRKTQVSWGKKWQYSTPIPC